MHPQSSEDLGPAIPRSILPEALHLRVPGERAVVGEGEEWALVELVEILAAVRRSFEEVRDRVEASLRAQRAQGAFGEVLQRARADADIKIDESVIADEALWK